MVKYSIILPVRNGGQYVKQCVQSILAQTYTSFNFIILDNCSTDGTLEWLQTLDDDRIQIIPSQKSLTIEESWGRVVGAEKNEFITLIGHDDILSPDFLQTIDGLIAEHPNAGLYTTHYNFIDAKDGLIRKAKRMEAIYTGSSFLTDFLCGRLESMGTGYVMRSKDYDRLGGIPIKYPNLLYADFELWIKLIGDSFLTVSPKNCFSFRLHQSTTNTSKDLILHSALQVFINFLANLKETDAALCKTIETHGATFLQNTCKSYAHRLLRTPKKNRNGANVSMLITKSKMWAEQLGIAAVYFPEKSISLLLAKWIDNSSLLRTCFLFFKKVYPKPVF
jgi:glycosyltransferase involved in cell wall biosynthesis